MPQALNMPGFWICQGSEYAMILNMQQLRTVSNVFECAWKIMNIPEYVWILLKKKASRYNITSSICYFIALPDTGNHIFIDGRA